MALHCTATAVALHCHCHGTAIPLKSFRITLPLHVSRHGTTLHCTTTTKGASRIITWLINKERDRLGQNLFSAGCRQQRRHFFGRGTNALRSYGRWVAKSVQHPWNTLSTFLTVTPRPPGVGKQWIVPGFGVLVPSGMPHTIPS